MFQVNDMKSFKCLFEFVEEEAGVVLAVVVDDDHFMGMGRFGRGYREVGDEAGGFVAGADDDADGVLLGLIFWSRENRRPAF